MWKAIGSVFELIRRLFEGTRSSAHSSNWRHGENVHLRFGYSTSTGTVRPNNEDRLFVDPDQNLIMVADGMGGQQAGEVASQMAVDLIPRQLVRLRADADENAIRDALKTSFSQTNEAILHRAQTDHTTTNMGTTVVLAKLQGSEAIVAHIGDSRAYHIRGRAVEAVTRDHNLAQALRDAGTITDEELKNHRYRNVLYKYLGMKEPNNEPDIRFVDLRAGDKLLLGSDGLTGHVSFDEILKLIDRTPDPQQAAKLLVDLALENGSKDNVTCVLVYVDAAPAAAVGNGAAH